MDLAGYLLAQHPPSKLEPALTGSGVAKPCADRDEADGVRQVVVAVHVGNFQVLLDELTVQVKSARNAQRQLWRRGITASVEQAEAPLQVVRANGYVHGADPVHAVAPWVFAFPVVELGDELRGKLFPAAEQPCLPEPRCVLKAAQFPWHLHVAL